MIFDKIINNKMISLNKLITNSLLFSSYVCINYNVSNYLISISSWDFIMGGDVPIMTYIIILTAIPFMALIEPNEHVEPDKIEYLTTKRNLCV